LRRLVLWTGLDAWRAEVASLDLTPRGVRAGGTQLGVDPLSYRLDYSLDAGEDFVTRSLSVEVTGEGWSRRIRLSHDGKGGWRCEAEEDGRAHLPPAGGDVRVVRGALDCDLARSPLTNLMPVRRHSLDRHPGDADFLMAWISVPALALEASRQRYEHVRRNGQVAIVRYVDLGPHSGFSSELQLDGDGLVLVYPQLARRVERSSNAADEP
jgi:uncharacterized protein